VSKLEQIRQLVDDSMSSPEGLAEEFCRLDDDAQARFFVHVARIASTWPRNQYGANAAEWQASAIGRHLKNCSCSTEEARDFVRDIAAEFEAQS
jgi:hypothetical protein